ncbi:aspartyl protease family protein At5g10770-like [Magnolia sinica]|uniref:aspartyl protease family protein At5g10770-like n=1 Tax=Magnolia sinica TaxID=86752 RepID=UPI00265B4022|nr:aspartyl protease family protein At5g10770-like [Magnolia sinica]
MANHSYLFLALLLFSSLFNRSIVFGANTDGYRVLSVQSLLLPAESCKSKEYKRPGLKIIHKHGPCSPITGQKATTLEIIQRDESRVNWIQSQLTDDSSRLNVQDITLPAHLGTSLRTSNYIVTVGFGTPKKEMTLEFDTGSDLTWIQCQPCAGSCYPQQQPIFNPSDSSSYLNLSCSSTQCSQLSLAAGCSSSTCIYFTAYGDGSNSTGFFANDTLSLTQSDVFPSFLFGCGQQNTGLFGNTAGLLGLGQGVLSLVSQTASKMGRVFSYCLPPTSSSTGYLTLGPNAIPSGIEFTPLITNASSPTFYFLNMTGMRVGGQALPIPASTFASPGTIIDSGTVISRLPPSAYTALRSAFRQGMSNYALLSPASIFDTCYDFSGPGNITVPTITLSFEGGVDVEVDFSGIIVPVNQTVGCLAFAGNANAGIWTIIGNRQQRTFDVVYDVAGGRVGFGPGGCS